MLNDPINAVDPSGLDAATMTMLGAAWTGAIIEPSPFGELGASIATVGALAVGGITFHELLNWLENTSDQSQPVPQSAADDCPTAQPPPEDPCQKICDLFKQIGPLNGKTINEIGEILQPYGFRDMGYTEGGYYKFYGPGSKTTRPEVWVRENGQIVRSSKIGRGKRFTPDGGMTDDHQGSEYIDGCGC